MVQLSCPPTQCTQISASRLGYPHSQHLPCVLDAQALPAGVEDLGLALNEVSAEGAADLAPALRGLRRLRRLSLRENELGNEGAASIAQALAATSTLEMLDMTQNQVSSCSLYDHVFPH